MNKALATTSLPAKTVVRSTLFLTPAKGFTVPFARMSKLKIGSQKELKSLWIAHISTMYLPYRMNLITFLNTTLELWEIFSSKQ